VKITFTAIVHTSDTDVLYLINCSTLAAEVADMYN